MCQMFGPRRILQVSAVPGLASWLLVALGSASLAALLMSRIMAGLSFGLLSGNVFLVHTASGDNLASLKMVEVSTECQGQSDPSYRYRITIRIRLRCVLCCSVCTHTHNAMFLCNTLTPHTFHLIVDKCF